MFALGIRYLMGWAMAAADGASKKQPEWPPHPDRVFMALAAAWFATGKDPAEGNALRWLECCGAPGFSVCLEYQKRHIVTHYVPVNDDSAPIKWDSQKKKWIFRPVMGSLCLGRNRQPRSFPVAIPHHPELHLVWDQCVPTTHRGPLAELCSKVTSIGHSASLVQMWLTDAPPAANLVPTSGSAQYRLRIFGEGRLTYLEDRCNRDRCIAYGELEHAAKNAKGKEKKGLKKRLEQEFPEGRPVSLRPEPGRWQGYSFPTTAVADQPPSSVFDPRILIMSLCSGKRLPLNATLKLTHALRGALLSACPDPIPEWVSGHDHQGRASKDPHVAMVPLPFVGREHADGRVMGLGIILPRSLEPKEAARVLDPWLLDQYGLPSRIRLFEGEWLECTLELETREQPHYNLRLDTWNGPARRWGSVTPVVLDRHFDGPNKWDLAAESIKDSCERIGLPRPVEVLLHPVSRFQGVPRSNEFPWISRKKDGGRMHHAHAVIVFGQKIQGPVVIGAGRFRGYGWCRPLRQRRE